MRISWTDGLYFDDTKKHGKQLKRQVFYMIYQNFWPETPSGFHKKKDQSIGYNRSEYLGQNIPSLKNDVFQYELTLPML